MELTYKCRECGTLAKFEYPPEPNSAPLACGPCYRKGRESRLKLLASEEWAHLDKMLLSTEQRAELLYYAVFVLQNFVGTQPYVGDPHEVHKFMHQSTVLMAEIAELLAISLKAPHDQNHC